MSNVCENSTCTCTKGYISLGQLCYEGKKFNKIEYIWVKKSRWDDKPQTKNQTNIKIGIQVKKVFKKQALKSNSDKQISKKKKSKQAISAHTL